MKKKDSKRRQNYLEPKGSSTSAANFTGNANSYPVNQNQYNQLGFPGTMNSWGIGNNGNGDGMMPDLNIQNALYNSRAIPVHPNWQILLRYFQSNALFNVCVQRPVDDAISLENINIRAKKGLDDYQLDDLIYSLKKTSFIKQFKSACCAARIFGGGVLLFLNKHLEKNKNELCKNEKNVSVIVADCWQVNRTGEWEVIDDTIQPAYNSPLRYMTHNQIWKYFGAEIHPSRAVIIKNNLPYNFWLDITRGWGISEYDTLGAALSQWDRFWDSVFQLLKSANIDIMVVEDLRAALQNPQAQADTTQKVQIFSYLKSTLGTALMQAGDSLERKQIDLGWIAQTADKLADVVCMASSIPKSYLFGEQPKGINNGGEASMEIYAAKIAALRSDYTPPLIEAFEKFSKVYLGIEIENLDVEFGTLRKPTFDEDIAMKTFQRTAAREDFESGFIDEQQFAEIMNKLDILPTEYISKTKLDQCASEEDLNSKGDRNED